MDELNITLKKFDIATMKDDSVIAMIAKRNSGKSVLCRDILYHHRNMPAGVIISPTEKANSYYGDFIPDCFIHDEFDAIIISKLLQRQEILMHKQKKNPSVDPRAFLILDDCLYDNKWIKDTNMRGVFMNGRHYKLMFILTMQFALGIPPNLRTNIDYVFILRENQVSNRKRIYDHYAGMFPTFEMFCKVMDKCTQDYECLVIHNGAKSNSIADQIFWYKADIHSDFKMGSPTYWNYHKKKYNKNNNNPYLKNQLTNVDPLFCRQNKNRLSLKVEKSND
jgi:hypothetical protein